MQRLFLIVEFCFIGIILVVYSCSIPPLKEKRGKKSDRSIASVENANSEKLINKPVNLSANKKAHSRDFIEYSKVNHNFVRYSYGLMNNDGSIKIIYPYFSSRSHNSNTEFYGYSSKSFEGAICKYLGFSKRSDLYSPIIKKIEVPLVVMDEDSIVKKNYYGKEYFAAINCDDFIYSRVKISNVSYRSKSRYSGLTRYNAPYVKLENDIISDRAISKNSNLASVCGLLGHKYFRKGSLKVGGKKKHLSTNQVVINSKKEVWYFESPNPLLRNSILSIECFD